MLSIKLLGIILHTSLFLFLHISIVQANFGEFSSKQYCLRTGACMLFYTQFFRPKLGYNDPRVTENGKPNIYFEESRKKDQGPCSCDEPTATKCEAAIVKFTTNYIKTELKNDCAEKLNSTENPCRAWDFYYLLTDCLQNDPEVPKLILEDGQAWVNSKCLDTTVVDSVCSKQCAAIKGSTPIKTTNSEGKTNKTPTTVVSPKPSQVNDRECFCGRGGGKFYKCHQFATQCKNNPEKFRCSCDVVCKKHGYVDNGTATCVEPLEGFDALFG